VLCACDAVIVALSKFENTILQIFVDHIYGLTKPVTTRKKTLVHKMALKILQGNDTKAANGNCHELTVKNLGNGWWEVDGRRMDEKTYRLRYGKDPRPNA